MATNDIHYVTTEDTWNKLANISKTKFLDHKGNVAEYKNTLGKLKLEDTKGTNQTADQYVSEICKNNRNLLDNQKRT